MVDDEQLAQFEQLDPIRFEVPPTPGSRRYTSIREHAMNLALNPEPTLDTKTSPSRRRGRRWRFVAVDRTTPDDIPTPDIGDLSRRARRRQRRQRVERAVASVTVILALVATALVAVNARGGRGDTDAVWAGPGGDPLTEPVGRWARAEDPPFSPRFRALHGSLSDGRVLIWSGFEPGGGWVTDGGIFDPSTGRWEPIPPAPLQDVDLEVTQRAWLSGDRLAVFSTGRSQDDLLPEVAVYDVVTGRWLATPAPVDAQSAVMAWDGETVALVDLKSGAPPWRWRIGQAAWERGTPAPIAARRDAGSAFDGRQLAVWAGTAGEARATDGAIYDVTADRWSMLPAAPVQGGEAPMAVWFEGRLVVGPSRIDPEPAGDDIGEAGPMAAYDPLTGTWEVVPSAPDGGVGVGSPPFAERGDAGRWSWSAWIGSGPTPFVLSAPNGGLGRLDQPVDHLSAAWFLDSSDWERTPSGNLFRLDHYIVAATIDERAGHTIAGFGLQVRDATGQWLHAAEAPFRFRIGAAIVPSGDKLVVVGGSDNASQLPHHDTWVFDLAG